MVPPGTSIEGSSFLGQRSEFHSECKIKKSKNHGSLTIGCRLARITLGTLVESGVLMWLLCWKALESSDFLTSEILESTSASDVFASVALKQHI